MLGDRLSKNFTLAEGTNSVAHLPFDQLIWESGNKRQPAWVHVSYSTKHNCKEVLRMKVVGGEKKYSAY